ncbi:Uncharacterized protein Rs2_22422 [Raphanus sativus]|uniref:Uncharacterized protein LOC108859392 n=1 Tax=Raphanus sativus TaxID=3726 RepID=A0A6J0NYR3_RAPSA|nr:uncharacterized protein LOC108859392 [Raphanus sativus]KAJ4895628.1 Uncharacterized protein Rs2_22422 [Raphanus sativus]
MRSEGNMFNLICNNAHKSPVRISGGVVKEDEDWTFVSRRLREREREMGIVSKAGDWSFKAFTAGLGFATIYLTATFSVNVYRGLSWHNSQSKLEMEQSEEETE